MCNIYVLFCHSFGVGGGQAYVNSKVRYLKKSGWQPIVFFASLTGFDRNQWESLREQKNNYNPYLKFAPEFWNDNIVQNVIDWMIKTIGYNENNNNYIIIESCTDYFAEWSERVATLIHAKHFCFLLDEELDKYRAKEFLYYKYLRNELAGIHKSSMKKLFGRDDIYVDDSHVLKASYDSTVQDIYSAEVSEIIRQDWNILYIGRNKQYINNIIKGIHRFAQTHQDKKIHLIVLGDMGNLGSLQAQKNLTITMLGFITPIPRMLFSKADVVIAGAGSAILSAREGVPTIVADAKSCLASGVSGYTVFDSLFSEKDGVTFDVALEDVLVAKGYLKYEFKPLGKSSSPEESYKKHFDYIEHSSKSIEYFDFKKNPQDINPSDLRKFRKYKIRIKYSGLYKIGSKIIHHMSDY